MAQLKDTVIQGSARVTDTLYADVVQTKILNAPTASGGTAYGAGSSGQALLSNGTTAYWGTISGTVSNGTNNYLLVGKGTSTAPAWTSPKDTLNMMINQLDTGSSNLTANDYVITQYVNGGTTTTTYHRRPASAMRVGGLLTARKLKVALGSTAEASFDGTADQTSIPISGTLGAGYGGTGQTQYTIGDILYCKTANALDKLSGNTTTTKKFLRSVATTAGTATAPAWDTIAATDIPYLDWSKINSGKPTTLSGYGITDAATSSHVQAADKGGTGQTTYTIGDILYSNATNTLSKLGGNTTTTRKFLRSVATTSGTAVAPAWDTLAAGDIPNLSWNKITSDKPTTLSGYGITDAATSTHTQAVNYGGTGITQYTVGDMIYASGQTTLAVTAGNTTTTRKFLRSVATTAGTATKPIWDTVTKTDVGLSNVENTKLSTWTGSASITTLGTITTGTWTGTEIAVANGGTGATSASGARTNLGLGAAAVKGVTDNDGNADVTSTDQNLITGRTLYYQLAKKGYTTNTGTVTGITLIAGAGIVLDTDNTAITVSGSRTISISGVDTTNGSTSQCLTKKGTWASFTNNQGTVTSVILTSGSGITVSDSGTAITGSGSRTISITGMNTSSGSTSKCLTEKGTWASFSNNSGTVTSVTLTSGAGITVSDSGTAITGSGSRTISITGVDTSSGSTTQCLTKKGTWASFTNNAGTVTSVQVQASDPLQSSTSTAQSVSLNTTISFKTQSANTVLAGPESGSTKVAPTFRTLVAADIPNLDWSKITSGKPTTLSGYGITDAATSASLGNYVSKAGDTMTGNLIANNYCTKWGYEYLNSSNVNVGGFYIDTYNDNNQFYIDEYTAGGTTSGVRECYLLPSPTASVATWYNILTDKNAVTIAQGGTGATTRLGAAANLCAESVASPEYVVGLTSSFANFGYTSIANLKTTLGLGTAAYVATSTFMAASPPGIELMPGSSSAGHGGYIDFHFNNSSADNTSRIIESASGVLYANGVKLDNSCVTVPGGNVYIDRSDYPYIHLRNSSAQEIGGLWASVSAKRVYIRVRPSAGSGNATDIIFPAAASSNANYYVYTSANFSLSGTTLTITPPS